MNKYTYLPGANLTPRQLAERAMKVAEATEDGRAVETRVNRKPRNGVSWSAASVVSAVQTCYDIRIERCPFAWARVGGKDGANIASHANKHLIEQWCEYYGGELKPLYLGDDDE